MQTGESLIDVSLWWSFKCYLTWFIWNPLTLHVRETYVCPFKAWSSATVSVSAVFSQVWEHHCVFYMLHLNPSDICVGCFPFINIGELHLLPWWLVRRQRQIKFPWVRNLSFRLFELELGALAALRRGSENHCHKNDFCVVLLCAPGFQIWFMAAHLKKKKKSRLHLILLQEIIM